MERRYYVVIDRKGIVKGGPSPLDACITFKELAEMDLPSDEEVAACKRWIKANIKRTNTIRPRSHSYYMKHVVEKEAGLYISNGAFIKAAYVLGFKIQRVNDINACFNMTPNERGKRWVAV